MELKRFKAVRGLVGRNAIRAYHVVSVTSWLQEMDEYCSARSEIYDWKEEASRYKNMLK